MRYLLALAVLLAGSARAAEIPLKSIYSTSPEKGMQEVSSAKIESGNYDGFKRVLGRIRREWRSGASNIFLVDAESIERAVAHDLDAYPDFSIWLPGRDKPLLAECKNVRESGKAGGEAYRLGGKVVAFKVETQKTRAAKGDPSSRYYGFEQYHILGVCLGKKTGDWSDFLFVRTIDLVRHSEHSQKLAVMQRVPLPDAEDLTPWYADLGELLRHFDDPPCSPSTKRS